MKSGRRCPGVLWSRIWLSGRNSSVWSTYTAAGFKKYGLFKKELEEYGRLTTFKERVNFYTSLAVKELQGAPLSEAEYEKLRTGNLSYLAAALRRGGHPGGEGKAGGPHRGYSHRRREGPDSL